MPNFLPTETNDAPEYHYARKTSGSASRCNVSIRNARSRSASSQAPRARGRPDPMREVVPFLDQAALWRLTRHVCTDLFTLGRLSEAGLRFHLRGLGYSEGEIAAEVEFLRGRTAA